MGKPSFLLYPPPLWTPALTAFQPAFRAAKGRWKGKPRGPSPLVTLALLRIDISKKEEEKEEAKIGLSFFVISVSPPSPIFSFLRKKARLRISCCKQPFLPFRHCNRWRHVNFCSTYYEAIFQTKSIGSLVVLYALFRVSHVYNVQLAR